MVPGEGAALPRETTGRRLALAWFWRKPGGSPDVLTEAGKEKSRREAGFHDTLI
jgi:hypothetical protein